jgi:hypothetical protein
LIGEMGRRAAGRPVVPLSAIVFGSFARGAADNESDIDTVLVRPAGVKAADPDTACEHETIEIPADWAAPGFDDSGWAAATEWSAADVGPKDGYDEISWDPAAKLVWGSDLKIDNTILLRATVSG